MLISEFVNLRNWLDGLEEEFGVFYKLNDLHNVLSSNVKAQRNNQLNQIESFSEIKNDVVEAIASIQIGELSNAQLRCLQFHEVDSEMGLVASEAIKEIFRDEGQDLIYLDERVTEIHRKYSNARRQITEVAESINPYFDFISPDDYLSENARFSVIFKEDVGVSSIEELEARAKEWKTILHALGAALNLSQTEFKFLGARNGCLIIDLSLAALATYPIGIILNNAFRMIERFAVMVKRVKLISEGDIHDEAYMEFQKDVEASADKYFQAKKLVTAKEVADTVYQSLGKKDVSEEVRSKMEIAIKKILDHLRKGGDLDIFVPSYESDEEYEEEEGVEDVNQELEERQNVIEMVKLLREFRSRKREYPDDLVKLLEHFDFNDNDDED